MCEWHDQRGHRIFLCWDGVLAELSQEPLPSASMDNARGGSTPRRGLEALSFV